MSEPFEISTTFANIVKPDPPNALEIRALNCTAFEVKWKAPEGLENSDVYPLDYIVSYTCRKKVATEKVVIGSTSVILTKLRPYTEYEVSVRAVPANGRGYQSDERSAKQRTMESKPSAAPVFYAGSFRTSELGSDKRNVTIYWGDIPEDDVNGVLRSFVIQLQSLDLNSTAVFYCPNNVFTKSLQLDADKAYLISVAGRTVADGVSGSIYIPAHHNVHQPKHVEGVVDKNKASVQFSIIPPDDTVIANYTLLYCEGLITNGILDRRKCKPGCAPVPLTFPADNQTLTFDGHNPNYVYAIAVNYQDGGSSGLSPKWLCLFDYDGAPVKPAMRFPEKQEEKSLTIELVQPKCSQDSRGRVTYYELIVLHKDELIRNYTILVGYSDVVLKTIPDLDAFTTYTLVLTACTDVMCGDPHSVSHRTVESAPSGPPLNVSAKVQNGQALLCWQPPIIPSGIITHYLILIKNESHPDSIIPIVNTGNNNTEILLADLSGYTNYSFQIKAGNSAGVSDPTDPVHLFMPIKAPGSVTFNADAVDRSTISIKLTPPQPANGPNPQYLLMAVFNNLEKTYSISENDYKLTVDCPDENDLMVNLSVLAVNTLQNGTKVQGPVGDVKTLPMCGQENDIIVQIVLSVVGSLILVIMFAALAYICVLKCCKRDSEKIIMPQINQLEQNMISQDQDDSGYTDYTQVDIPRSDDLNSDVDEDSGITNSQNGCQSSNGALCDETHSQKIRMSSEEDQQEEVDTPQSSIPSEMGILEYSKATDAQHIYQIISSDSEASATDHKKDIDQPVMDPPVTDDINSHINSPCVVIDMDADDSDEYETDSSEENTNLKSDPGYRGGTEIFQDPVFELPPSSHSGSDADSGSNDEFESKDLDIIQVEVGRRDHDTVCSSSSCQPEQNTTSVDQVDTGHIGFNKDAMQNRTLDNNSGGMADSGNSYHYNNRMFSDKTDSRKIKISSDQEEQEEQGAEYSQVGKNQQASGREVSVTDSISPHSQLDTDDKKDVIQPMPDPAVVDGSNGHLNSPCVVFDMDVDDSDEYETDSGEDNTNLKSDPGYRGGTELFQDLVFELPPSSHSGSDADSGSNDNLEAGDLDNIQIKLDQENHEAIC